MCYVWEQKALCSTVLVTHPTALVNHWKMQHSFAKVTVTFATDTSDICDCVLCLNVDWTKYSFPQRFRHTSS